FVNEANHCRDEEHANRCEVGWFGDVPDDLLDPDDDAQRDREAEQSRDSAKFRNFVFCDLLTSLPTIPPSRIFRRRPGIAITTIAREKLNVVAAARRRVPSIAPAGENNELTDIRQREARPPS